MHSDPCAPPPSLSWPPSVPLVTRFAPSPTGRLHLGHAFSALLAFDTARAAGGRVLLRIEDIDTARCRPEFEAGILEDLAWLGLEWDEPVRRQSDHLATYRAALERLEARGLVYPCFCTRKEIQDEVARRLSAPHGPDGPLYPGTCRALDSAGRAARLAAGEPHALRLDMAAALRRVAERAAAHRLPEGLWWLDREAGRVSAQPQDFGDVVLARKDTPTSYHLAATLDDALQGVTLVVRGQDLFAATHVHRLLQALLNLPVPVYHHHRLLTGPDGRRLAKRDKAQTLDSLRRAGHTPRAVRRMVGLDPAGVGPFSEA